MFEVDLEARRGSGLLDDIERRLDRPEQLLDVLVDEVHRYETDVFATGGHGTWPALDPETAARKGSSRILVDSGDLLAALTSSADLLGDSLAVTADVAYAGFHKTGTGRMPRRDPAPEPPASVTGEWARTLLDAIVDGR